MVFSAPADAERPPYLTVLCYEWFDDPWTPPSGTSLATFREQMAFLRRRDYRVVPIEAVRRMIASGEPLLPRLVVITIDGSSRDIYEKVFPILEEYGYPWVLFPHVKALDSELPGLLKWEMVRKIYASGMEVGSLTYSNGHLGLPGRGEGRDDYKTRVREEILNGRRALQAHGIRTDLLAFPHGEYNPIVIEEARRQGYGLMFTLDRGSMDSETPLTAIPRFSIASDIPLTRFEFELNLSPLHVADVRPEIGFLPTNPPGEFSLRIQDPDRYRPGIVNMFISEWGRVDAEYDPQEGRIVFRPGRQLKSEKNRLIVTARERAGEHFSIFSRLFFLPFRSLSEYSQ